MSPEFWVSVAALVVAIFAATAACRQYRLDRGPVSDEARDQVRDRRAMMVTALFFPGLIIFWVGSLGYMATSERIDPVGHTLSEVSALLASDIADSSWRYVIALGLTLTIPAYLYAPIVLCSFLWEKVNSEFAEMQKEMG